MASVAALFFAAGLLSSCGGSSKAGVQGPSEVRAEPVSTTTNPFTEPVGNDKSGVMPPAAAVNSHGGPPTYTGSLPGLYGGTRDYKTCDAGKLVAFLEENPAKAAVWAQTLGIRASEIREYVSSLTPVLLRTDTRVTNHGYKDAEADPIQSVLQAGTAVFVNKYGAPVVKCYCGNPLTPPQLYTNPRYYGAKWTGFAPASITIINQSTTIIDTFQLYDPNTGKLFPRKAGRWNPGSDGPYSGGTPTPPSGATTTTKTPPPAGSRSPSGRPTASFSPSSGQVGDTYVLSVSGFAPGATLDLTVLLPNGQGDGVARSISIGSDGRGSYTFYNGGAGSRGGPGTYTAVVEDRQTQARAQAVVGVAPASSRSSTTTTNAETTTTNTSTPAPEGGTETP